MTILDKPLAALMFFTKLPFYKIKEVEASAFKSVVNYWPIAGVLSGGIMALVLWGASEIFPYSVAVILAILSRVLITGALHEDGLADFFDGFGGGTTKERVLAIMKDSQTGSYALIGLIIYFLLLWNCLITLPLNIAVPLVFLYDISCKFIASNIVNLLPYARKEHESKAKVIYNRVPPALMIFHLIWIAALWYFLSPDILFALSLVASVVLFFLLIAYMKRRIEGYTGDCCGAIFLMCELVALLGAFVLFRSWHC